jgi:hypothetical protein
VEISDNVTNDEIEVFASLIKQDSIKGHYDKQFSDLTFCKKYLFHIKQTSQILGYPSTGLILVFRVDHKAVSFAVVCSSFVSEFDSEILFFSTLSQHRKQGSGKAAIELILEEVKGKSVLARCVPKSKAMCRLLNRRGFNQITLGNSKNVNFVHKNC